MKERQVRGILHLACGLGSVWMKAGLPQKFDKYSLLMEQERIKLQRGFQGLSDQESLINPVFKQQFHFLKKFYCNLLSDQFHADMRNLHQDFLYKRIQKPALRKVASQIYIPKRNLAFTNFETKMKSILTQRSPSMQAGELSFPFKLLYLSSGNPDQAQLEADEPLFVEVKIRCDRNTVEQLPIMVKRDIQQIQRLQPQDDAQTELMKRMEDLSRAGRITIMLVYFGDADFLRFQLSAYQANRIMMGGRSLNVRIAVFYVSRIALTETFNFFSRRPPQQQMRGLAMQGYSNRRDAMIMRRFQRYQDDMEQLRAKGRARLLLMATGFLIITALAFIWRDLV